MEGESNRRIKNMNGLLNFCTELTALEDTTHPSQLKELDPERKEFLDNVLSSMVSNVPKILLECIRKLSNDNSSNSEKEDALDELTEYLDDVDHATDFYKLGGCQVLVNHLASTNMRERHLSAQLIGDICQNNPVLQNVLLTLDTLSKLLKMISSDSEEICRVRAMYAISCLVRENRECQKTFLKLDGIKFLINIFQERREELITKTVFLLNNLYGQEAFKELLTNSEFVEILSLLLHSDIKLDDIAREYITSLLLRITEGNKVIQRSIKMESFFDYVQTRLKCIRGKAEFQEEESYLQSLLRVCKEE